jgi:membrane fusion protein, multidrug efflux system
MEAEKEDVKPEAAEKAPAAGKPNGNGKRKKAGIVLALCIVAGLVLGVKWWVKSQTDIATDNAFVETHIHSISPRIAGNVTRVYVIDNQEVKKGEILVELDSHDYEAKVREMAGSVGVAKNETSGDYAQVESARASVTLARAKLEQAELDLKRGKNLFGREVIPREQLDRLETARKVSASQLKEAEEAQRKAQAMVGGTGGREARVAEKEGKLLQARLSLEYTKIYAPADGYITRKSVEPGNNVQPGQPLMALVPLEDAWVTANYKERQLAHVRPGQKVLFTVDAYPGHKFTGRVDSVMAGTGAAFSLLPPENATGNYVKVVQRIPVKIRIDKGSDPEHLLRVGMSVVPTIETGRTFSDIISDFHFF